MNPTRRSICALAVGVICPPVLAQAYPSKRIEFVVAGGAGGGLDLVGRELEQAMRETKVTDQPIVIVNMGAGGGNAATTYVQRHKGDAHMLYLNTNRLYLNRLAGTINVGQEAVTPIGRVMTEYLVWVVRADSPFRTAKDLLDKMRSDPASVTFGISSIPSNDQINVVAPAIASGIDARKLRIVAFSSALNSQLLGGHVTALSTPLSEIAPLVRAGQVRLLSVSSPDKLGGEVAQVPTWRSVGIDVAVLHWRGLFAPPGIPADALRFWERSLGQLTKSEPWKRALEKHGWYEAYADSATFQKDMAAEVARYSRIMSELGLIKS
jgi:putative tricarboxylic transport membrane protein